MCEVNVAVVELFYIYFLLLRLSVIVLERSICFINRLSENVIYYLLVTSKLLEFWIYYYYVNLYHWLNVSWWSKQRVRWAPDLVCGSCKVITSLQTGNVPTTCLYLPASDMVLKYSSTVNKYHTSVTVSCHIL